jgi:diguanylate cyclase (GGDEF)-like protein
VVGHGRRVDGRLAAIGAAAVLFAAVWAVPDWAQPVLAAVAVIAASATGRAGGLLAAVAVAATPLPVPLRVALAVGAVVNGELHEHRRRAGRRLAVRSFTDRLTGLRNYDFFAESLRAEVARVRRYGGCVTLVILDLDRFKSYNDHHGHSAGNRLLASVGQTITREKRDADVAARFGGEEFALLVSGRTSDGVRAAERLRAAIAELSPAPSSRRDFSPGVSASAGVATFPVDARDARELFDLADAALYEAKRRGRDQVVTASELADHLMPVAN